MMKKTLILTALALVVTMLLAACVNVTEPPVPTDGPAATDVPSNTGEAAVTEDPVSTPEATPVVTAAPTDTPEPTATPLPKPEIKYTGEAELVDIYDDYYVECSACDYEIKEGEPWITIVTDTGDNYIVFKFSDIIYQSDYPLIAFKYRIGYGQSIRPTNHFYAITASGAASPLAGMWSDIDFLDDLDWHVGILDLQEQFPAAGEEWWGIRFPTVDTVGGDFAIAWVGAFTGEEDVQAYDAAFNEAYGEKLVKAEKPAETKKERFPEKLVDAFDGDLFDFEDCYDGDLLTSYPGDEWTASFGLRTSAFVEHEGSIVLNLTFDAFYHDSLVKAGKGFTASFDFMNAGPRNGNFGGFVMGFGDENNSKRDFYENSYGKDGVDSLVSRSGIGVDFREGNKICVFVNRWNVETNKRDVVFAEIETGVNFDEKMVSFLIDDDGESRITVSADGQLLFTVTYTDPGILGDAVGYYEQYFRSVTISDPEGNELLKTDSALFSIYDSFGFGARARNLLIDNIQVKTKE